MAAADIDGIVRAVRDSLRIKHERVTEADVRDALAASPVPDLLAACEMALATFRRDRLEEIDDREPEIDALRAAIAKGRGEDR